MSATMVHECYDHLQTGSAGVSGAPTVDCTHDDHQATIFEAGGIPTIEELLDGNTLKDLKSMAVRLGVSLPPNSTKRSVAEAISDHLAEDEAAEEDGE